MHIGDDNIVADVPAERTEKLQVFKMAVGNEPIVELVADPAGENLEKTMILFSHALHR